MPLICVPPGGTIDPLQQSRKIGAYISLTDLGSAIQLYEFHSDEFLNFIGDAIKNEFITLMRDFLEGKRVSIVRRLPFPETISR